VAVVPGFANWSLVITKTKTFYILFLVLSVSLSALSQKEEITPREPQATHPEATITPGVPRTINYIQITNNTHPTATSTDPSSGFWGRFVLQFSVASGPCLAAGAIRTYTISSGGTGYAVGDTGIIGTGNATYKVSALNGTSVNAITIAAPYGSGYAISPGVSTTATGGNGTGLTINITGIYNGTPGPNCVTVQDQTENGGWVSSVCRDAACSNGDAITFAHVDPAGAALDGTYRTDYASSFTQYIPIVSTPGAGQTPGKYLLYPTGGGGTGMEIFVTVNANGTVTAQPIIQWYGIGYNSCPTIKLMAGGTPATFSCQPNTTPAYTFDTSIAAGTNYYQLSTLNDTSGMTTDHSGNVWGVYSEAYPNQLNIGESYVSIHKSTDGGESYSLGKPFLIDQGTHCGGATVPCSYVTASLATAPNGNLVVGYWIYDNSGSPLVPQSQCCWTIYCNPSSADCTQISNWSKPYPFPATPVVRPRVFRCLARTSRCAPAAVVPPAHESSVPHTAACFDTRGRCSENC